MSGSGHFSESNSSTAKAMSHDPYPLGTRVYLWYQSTPARLQIVSVKALLQYNTYRVVKGTVISVNALLQYLSGESRWGEA